MKERRQEARGQAEEENKEAAEDRVFRITYGQYIPGPIGEFGNKWVINDKNQSRTDIFGEEQKKVRKVLRKEFGSNV